MALNGLLSCVNGIAARNWSITPAAEISEYADTGTSGARGRLKGNVDWTGQYSAYGATPEAMPGEALSFIGSIDGTNGAAGTAIVDQVEITWDNEGMKPIEHVVSFSGNGALTLGAAAGTAGAVALPPVADENCILALGTVAAEPVWTDVDVRTMKLTISRDNAAYSDTSTAGGKRRLAGTWDVSVAFSRYCDSFASLTAVNTVKGIRLYANATTYWEILWVIFSAPTGLDVDREDLTKVIGATENAALCAVATVGTTDTIGSITAPDETVIWPPAE